MITTLFLSSALAIGQVPAQAGPPVRTFVPVAMQGPGPVAVPMPVAQPAPMLPGAPMKPLAPMAMPAAPMATPAAPAAVPAPVEAPTTSAAPDSKPEEEKKEDEKAPPKYLIERLMEGSVAGKTLLDSGIKVYGWAAMNYTGSSATRSNAPITFNNRANFFQFNQNWLEASKNVDTSKNEFQIGFKSSIILPGYDYVYTLPRGLWNSQLARGEQYGFDPVYQYLEAFLPNLGSKGTTLRVGRWGTQVGYEVIEAVGTPFVTKSYNFQYNPFTHTGAQATTQITDNITVYNGIVTGADVFIDPAGTPSYVGGIKWAPKDSKTTIAFNTMITGQGFNLDRAFQHFNCYNIVLTHKFSDKFNYVLDATAANTISTDPNGPAGGRAASWYGFANYFIYTLSDKVTSNFRVELFEDSQGARTGTKGLYTELTYGLTWTPIDAMLVRPFVRYDHNTNGPFEGKNNLYTGGMEVIFRY